MLTIFCFFSDCLLLVSNQLCYITASSQVLRDSLWHSKKNKKYKSSTICCLNKFIRADWRFTTQLKGKFTYCVSSLEHIQSSLNFFNYSRYYVWGILINSFTCICNSRAKMTFLSEFQSNYNQFPTKRAFINGSPRHAMNWYWMLVTI